MADLVADSFGLVGSRAEPVADSFGLVGSRGILVADGVGLVGSREVEAEGGGAGVDAGVATKAASVIGVLLETTMYSIRMSTAPRAAISMPLDRGRRSACTLRRARRRAERETQGCNGSEEHGTTTGSLAAAPSVTYNCRGDITQKNNQAADAEDPPAGCAPGAIRRMRETCARRLYVGM